LNKLAFLARIFKYIFYYFVLWWQTWLVFVFCTYVVCAKYIFSCSCANIWKRR